MMIMFDLRLSRIFLCIAKKSANLFLEILLLNLFSKAFCKDYDSDQM